MRGWQEFGIALARITMGVVALTLGILILIFISFLHITSSYYYEKIAAAYDSSYAKGYAQTYDDSYHKAFTSAYDKGYTKGYEMGLGASSEKRVATRVELRNPSHKELKEFLARDKTDVNLYISEEYVSFDFAVDLNNNAELEGIRAAFVTVIFPEKSHGIVAFDTADKGLIYIEPQSDREVDVVLGKRYWWSASGISAIYYDDTIVEIQVLW